MKTLLLIVLCSALSACASFSSAPVNGTTAADGLMYHLPKRDITLTVTVDAAKGVTNVIVGQTATYADISSSYMLTHNLGLFTKHTTDIAVKDGLLTTSNSKVETKFSDVVKAVAGATGTFDTKFIPRDKPTNDNGKCGAGTHVFILAVPEAPQTLHYCANSFAVTITPLGALPEFKNDSYSVPADASRNGVYYRQNLPYVFDIKSTDLEGKPVPGMRESGMLMSPSQSPRLFLPIKSALFSDAQSTFEFDAGVPKKITYTSDSELVGLFKIPADVATAYFTAVGAVFTQFNTRDTNEQTRMENMLKLEMLKKKFDACLAAIQADKKELITSLGCGS